MQAINFLKPNRDNIKNYSIIGSVLILISLIDVISNAFLKTNLTSFLPGSLSSLFPLIIGLIGLNMMRIDYSGNKTLDKLNKNINTNNFNAVLTLLILFSIIKALPPSLSWMILDANISGDSKDACTEQELAGRILKSGLEDLCMECIQMNFIGELILRSF